MTKRNPCFHLLQETYLFPKVRSYKMALQKKEPHAHIISLSIGDTTEPITPFITEALETVSRGLGKKESYYGYGNEQGLHELRQSIASALYDNKVSAEEVFVSDGAKCDISRLQLLFAPNASIAIQNPTYPVYLDTSIMAGKQNIVFMPCNEENQFFPDLEHLKRTDLIFFCSPNNPTGATASKKQLQQLVDFAKKNRSIIIFDAAYNYFIQDKSIPKSIYEIDGADEVAIEIGSFSKLIGFTGVRLSWSVVPKKLRFECGGHIWNDWNRIMSTCFNGASIIAQKGGLAALTSQGMQEMHKLIQFYMTNTKMLKECLQKQNFIVYGGDNIPYLWVKVPGKNSWQAFEELLNNKHIVTTPGSGFGDSGEGFLRFSAFSPREDLEIAIQRLSQA